MNNTMISGRIVKDAETKTRNVGNVAKLVTEFTVAASYGPWDPKANDGRGGYMFTDFFKVPLWGESGAKLAPYLKKGREVTVTGSVTAQAWIGTQGANAGKAQATLVIRNGQVTLHGGKPEAAPETDPAEPELPFEPDAQ